MPGTSGVLSPFGKIDGLYFNESKEPDDCEFLLKKDIAKLMEEDDITYIEIKMDDKKDYYKLLDELSEFNKSSITVFGTSRNKETIIIEKEPEEDSDDESDGDTNEE